MTGGIMTSIGEASWLGKLSTEHTPSWDIRWKRIEVKSRQGGISYHMHLLKQRPSTASGEPHAKSNRAAPLCRMNQVPNQS
jgi:hypothetical protein